MSIPEVSTLVAVAVAIGGALYALRRQGDTQTVQANSDLAERVGQLEATNKYLVQEISKLERDNERMRETLSLLEEQVRDSKRRYERLTDENSALAKALGRNAQ